VGKNNAPLAKETKRGRKRAAFSRAKRHHFEFPKTNNKKGIDPRWEGKKKNASPAYRKGKTRDEHREKPSMHKRGRKVYEDQDLGGAQ